MCDIPLTSLLGWTVVWFFTAVELESAAVMRSTESVQYVFGFPDSAQGLCLCVFLCVFVCLPRASALQCITSALVDLPCGLDTLFLSLCLSLSLSPSLSLLHICLLHLYSFPSGLPADKVSLHRTNETITLVLFFTACPACSGKLLLNCSSVLQMNCPDNSISLLSSQRSRGAGEDLADSWLRVTAGPQSQEENHFILSESGMDITDTDVCFYNLHF